MREAPGAINADGDTKKERDDYREYSQRQADKRKETADKNWNERPSDTYTQFQLPIGDAKYTACAFWCVGKILENILGRIFSRAEWYDIYRAGVESESLRAFDCYIKLRNPFYDIAYKALGGKGPSPYTKSGPNDGTAIASVWRGATYYNRNRVMDEYDMSIINSTHFQVRDANGGNIKDPTGSPLPKYEPYEDWYYVYR